MTRLDIVPFTLQLASYQTVKVMHALNIDDETAAMLRTDLDVGISETAGNSIFV